MKDYYIEINMLPADEGDCLHIRLLSGDTRYNVVIDSGPSACAFQFRTLIDQIRNREEDVDLLCFTHIDDDHIKGAEQTFSERTFDSSHIKQIWMNLPDSIVKSSVTVQLPDYQNVTVESACRLFSYITARKIPCATKVVSGDQITLGSTQITAILPQPGRLQAYYRAWEKEEERLRRRKQYFPIGGVRRDTSPYNGSSISLMVTTEHGKLLFAGDAFATDLAVAARSHAGEEGFTLVKLPHHGSDRNVSVDLLDALNCRNFLISTQSTAYRPAQNTIDLLAEFGKSHDGVLLFGNYSWPFIRKPAQGLEIIKLLTSTNPIRIAGITLYSEG